MRYILCLVFLLVISGKVLADESVIVFIKETRYSLNGSDEKLNSEELESNLKKLKFSVVTFDVDYCAGPVMVAEAYIAVANAKPLIKDVKLRASGSHEVSKCKSL